MGTRNLTCVVKDGDYRIAQYGQWDGYPSGQGLTALRFVRDTMDRPRFDDALRRVRWVTDEEVQAAYVKAGAAPDATFVSMTVVERFDKIFPLLNRDHGAKILSLAQAATGDIPLRDGHDFARDSLFCEWAYVVDLDQNTFEVYTGFNKAPVPENERFARLEKDGDYYAIRHVATFPLDALPSDDAFPRSDRASRRDR